VNFRSLILYYFVTFKKSYAYETNKQQIVANDSSDVWSNVCADVVCHRLNRHLTCCSGHSVKKEFIGYL
jgi:hypothetical protein